MENELFDEISIFLFLSQILQYFNNYNFEHIGCKKMRFFYSYREFYILQFWYL